MVIERDQNNGSGTGNKEEVHDKKSEETQDDEEKEQNDLILTDVSTKSVFDTDLIEAFRERCSSLDSALKEERKLTSQARRTVRRHSVQHVQWLDESSGQTIPLQAEIPIPLQEETEDAEEESEEKVVQVQPIKIPTEKPRPILKKRRNSKVDPNQPTCVIIVHQDD